MVPLQAGHAIVRCLRERNARIARKVRREIDEHIDEHIDEQIDRQINQKADNDGAGREDERGVEGNIESDGIQNSMLKIALGPIEVSLQPEALIPGSGTVCMLSTTLGLPQAQDTRSVVHEKSAALIWLHGLGDSGDSWKRKFDDLPSLLSSHGTSSTLLQCVHPTATLQAVTANRGEHLASWFDINSLPVSVNEPVDPTGLQATILTLHDHIEELIQQGIPSNRIIIGGFSQGGAAAISAAISCRHKLCGVVCISGWLIRRCNPVDPVDRPPIIKQPNAVAPLPIFFSCGSGDPVVNFRLAKESANYLKADDRVAEKVFTYQRAKHMPTHQEMKEVREVIIKFLCD